MPVFQKEILAMTHHLKNAIIIQDNVYELEKLEDTNKYDACKSCALVDQCVDSTSEICQVIHNVNHVWDDETYNYKLLKLKPTMGK